MNSANYRENRISGGEKDKQLSMMKNEMRVKTDTEKRRALKMQMKKRRI